MSNLLCFVANKWHHVPAKPLKSLLFEFYSAEDICSSKELLFNEVDNAKLAQQCKIPRRRRISSNKSVNTATLDLDDIINLFVLLDEHKEINNIASFVASSPDGMPSIRLAEGDMAIVFQKLSKLEELVGNLRLDMGNISITRVNNMCPKVSEAQTGVCTINNSVNRPTHSVSMRDPTMEEVGYREKDTDFPVLAQSADCSYPLADTEIEQPFYVQLNRNQRRRVKRKEISPLSNNVVCSSDEDTSQTTKRIDTRAENVLRTSYAAATTCNSSRTVVTQPSQSTIHSNRLTIIPKGSMRVTGKSKSGGGIKAAEKDLAPMDIFCVSNVSSEFGVEDVRKHCVSLGVRIRFLYDITASHMKSRAFKLAIGRVDKAIITDANSWPDRVVVRNWRPVPVSRNIVSSDLVSGSISHNSDQVGLIPQEMPVHQPYRNLL